MRDGGDRERRRRGRDERYMMEVGAAGEEAGVGSDEGEV